jgi:hypothetical protein
MNTIVEATGRVKTAAHAYDSEDLPFERPLDFIGEMSYEERLEQLRRASNVIQALENLIVQCDDVEMFSSIRNSAHEALQQTRHYLQTIIHSI